MKAFHGDKEVKRKYLARVSAHAKADEIVKGRYWENGKGCAIGCTIHSSNHNAYEKELGVPKWLAIVEDVLFEGMLMNSAQKWPEQFLKAINVGANLEQVKTPFLIFILKNSLKSMKAIKYDKKAFPQVEAAQKQCETAVKEMIRCHKLGFSLSAAYSAADSAYSAADSAAYSAANSAVRSAANSAANSAADSAVYSAVYSAAYSAAYLKFSKELLRLLRVCKPTKKEKK
jgi:hypothetical protein